MERMRAGGPPADMWTWPSRWAPRSRPSRKRPDAARSAGASGGLKEMPTLVATLRRATAGDPITPDNY